MSHKYDYLFKILVIGDTIAGKTPFLLRYTDDSFAANHLTTIGIDFKIKIIDRDGKRIKLQIWDTANQLHFIKITKTYYKGAHAIILMYSITKRESFENIPQYMKNIEENGKNNVPIVLVGNNCDNPDRVVTEEEGRNLAEKYSIAFFETSPKTNQNINEVFDYLINGIFESSTGKNNNINIKSDNNSKKNGKNCAK